MRIESRAQIDSLCLVFDFHFHSFTQTKMAKRYQFHKLSDDHKQVARQKALNDPRDHEYYIENGDVFIAGPEKLEDQMNSDFDIDS